MYSSSLWSTTSCSLGNFKSIPIMPGKLPRTIESNSSKPCFWRKGSWKRIRHFHVWWWHWAKASSESALETGNTPFVHLSLFASNLAVASGLQALHFKRWQAAPYVHNARPCVCQDTPGIWRNQGPSCIRHYFTEIFSVSRVFEQSYW